MQAPQTYLSYYGWIPTCLFTHGTPVATEYNEEEIHVRTSYMKVDPNNTYVPNVTMTTCSQVRLLPFRTWSLERKLQPASPTRFETFTASESLKITSTTMETENSTTQT